MEASERVAGPKDECRLGAVSIVECRPMCRDMPLYAAICRSLERKLLIFLGLRFFFDPEWGVASDQRVTSGSAATKGGAGDAARREAFAAEGCSRIPPGAPLISRSYPFPKCRTPVLEPDRAVCFTRLTGRYL